MADDSDAEFSTEEFRAFLKETAEQPHMHSRAVHEAINQRLSGPDVPYRPPTAEQSLEAVVKQHGSAAITAALLPKVGDWYQVKIAPGTQHKVLGFYVVEHRIAVKLSPSAMGHQCSTWLDEWHDTYEPASETPDGA